MAIYTFISQSGMYYTFIKLDEEHVRSFGQKVPCIGAIGR